MAGSVGASILATRRLLFHWSGESPPNVLHGGGARRLEITERYERELGGFESIEEDFSHSRKLPERQPSPETWEC